MGTARKYLGGAGTQTAGLGFGGYKYGGYSNNTEEYSAGLTTTVKHMIILKEIKGQKVQVLATDPSTLLEGQLWYNSTSQTFKGAVYQPGSSGAWASGGNMSIERGALAGAGTQNAGLAFGGYDENYLDVTEEYNGSSWSSGGNLNNTRYDLAGAGTQTAGLAFGSNPVAAHTEEYNGTSWTSVNSMNTARAQLAGAGIQTAGLAFGGRAPGVTGSTEEYDGTNWSSGGTLGVARYMLAGAGTQTAGVSFGGYYPSITTVTEEYTGGTPAGNIATTLTAS
jgi:hypothetical protein